MDDRKIILGLVCSILCLVALCFKIASRVDRLETAVEAIKESYPDGQFKK